MIGIFNNCKLVDQILYEIDASILEIQAILNIFRFLHFTTVDIVLDRVRHKAAIDAQSSVSYRDI